MPIALIMAGGRSVRMRASLGTRHKALVEVLGVSMLERNILALLSHGFRDIRVVVSAQEKALAAFARGRGARVARAAGATLRVHLENKPRGTIGAARGVPAGSETVLVVNVDNLTSLDLSALLQHHRVTHTAMTIATHTELFPVPFGQVSIRKGRVTGYKEKPVLPVLLSSGTYVISPAARRMIPSGRPVGAPELVHILLREQRRISAFRHSAPWIDVNDSASVGRAEALIMANCREFDLWLEPAKREIVVLAAFKDQSVALVRNDSRAARRSTMLPVMQVLSESETPLETVSRLQQQMRLSAAKARLIASFDELDPRTRERTRCHLFACKLGARPNGRNPVARSGVRWLNVNQLPKAHGTSRTTAYLKRYIASTDPHFVGH
jgi:NDP-mannose synthase